MEGRFDHPGVGWTEGAFLYGSLDGFEPAQEPLPPGSRLDLTLVLQRATVGARSLVGRVLDVEREPVAGAWVSVGRRSVRTDADGGFVLEPEESWRGGTLLAVKQGFLPARTDVGDTRDGTGEREPIVLVLSAPSLAIAGRVVDGAGEPVLNAKVWTRDTVEYIHASYEYADGSVSSGPMSLETVMAGSNSGEDAGRMTRTDAAGRFELYGLADRPYRLLATNPRTMELAVLEGVQAGRDDALLVLAGAEASFRVAGRVVSRHGEPIEGVRLYRAAGRGSAERRSSFPSTRTMSR